jgi:chemotaxis protein CheX
LDTILLVNDSSTLTKVLSAHFRDAGYEVIAVTGVMDAYEAFIRHDVDLILTDFVLPDKDGLEVIETFRAKKHQKALPIVVFTAIQDDATANRCKAAGANLVLSKANGTAHLLEAIERLIEEYKAALPTSSLDRDLGRCIVKATSEVFRAMLGLRVTAGAVTVEKAMIRRAEVIGSIGIAGFLSGSISVLLPKSLARRAVATMLLLDSTSDLTDGDLADAVGELTNMIGGSIQTELFRKAPLFDISVPSVYIGDDLQRRTVCDDLCFHVPFTVGREQFCVEFLMATRKDAGTGAPTALADGMQKA